MHIIITSSVETEKGWETTAQVESREFRVEVDKGTYQRLTGGNIAPERLVEASFKFLLDKEPAGSIMSSFNLEVISNYFPHYQKEISKYF